MKNAEILRRESDSEAVSCIAAFDIAVNPIFYHERLEGSSVYSFIYSLKGSNLPLTTAMPTISSENH